MGASSSLSCEALLLIDHDNIPFGKVNLRQMLEVWLESLPDNAVPTGTISVLLRAYGGWFRQSHTSDARFKASEFYQEECPSLLRVASRYCRIHFEFADKLLLPLTSNKMATSLAITHTVAVRASAETVVARVGVPLCPEFDCQLSSVKKWIKRRRACTRGACPLEFKDQFERQQQKQVDVHLATDILTWAYTWNGTCPMAVASDDIDLLPALGAAAFARKGQSGVTLLRFLMSSSYLDGSLVDLGLRLVKV